MSKNISVPIFTSLVDPELTKLLRSGAVGVLLTDTVYGLVGRALDIEASSRVIDLKGRAHKPGTLIAASGDQLVELGIKRESIRTAERFWPGAVSIVLPDGQGYEYLDVGMKSLAVRIPNKPDLITLLQKVGPLLTSSANKTGEPTVKSIDEAQEIFGNSVDFYVDSGVAANPIPSTVIRIKNNRIEILRQGAVEI